jgi:hypothetical protein
VRELFGKIPTKDLHVTEEQTSMAGLVDMILGRAALVFAAILTVSATLATPSTAEDKPRTTNADNGWTNRESAVWNELAAKYGAADVSIARNMFPRASVDVYVYRDAVVWLQDQQDIRLDREKGTNTVRERWPYR